MSFTLTLDRMRVCVTVFAEVRFFVGRVRRFAVNFADVGQELSGPKLILVFGPGVLDVLGWDAGGEAAEARSEIDNAGEIGNSEAFLALRLVVFEGFTGEVEALVV